MKPNAIHYLSLARKAGRIEVGEEPTGAAARAGHARLVLVASDAPDNTFRRAKNFVAGTDQQLAVLPFTKEEMGSALGRTVVALAAMTDPAMALAFLKALDDEARYGAAIERLTAKAERIRRHQLEEKAHQKNIRTGKVRRGGKELTEKPAEEKRPGAKDARLEKRDYNRREKPAENRGGRNAKPYEKYGRAAEDRQSRKAWPEDGQKNGGKPAAMKSDRPGKPAYGTAGKRSYGRPAGQKYATGNKVAGRKPGRKTHGGAEE